MRQDRQIGRTRLTRQQAHKGNLRLLIASQHAIIRTALSMMLREMPHFEVAAQSDFPGIVQTVRKHGPDVVLMDLNESGLGGLRALARLMKAFPGAAVVILSSNENPSYIRSTLATGAKAYVLKSATNSELYAAIRTVYRGKTYLDPRLSDSIVCMLLGRNSGIPKPQAKRLSGREAEVLREIARGFTTRTIAERLGVSEKTIQTYRERIYTKLELRTRADLVHYAIAHGMLGLIEENS